MARITVEDCLKKVSSRFELVHLTAQRVRQIREGSEYLVVSPKNEDIVVALREIAAGKVTPETIEAGAPLFDEGGDPFASDKSLAETFAEDTQSGEAEGEEEDEEEEGDEEEGNWEE